MATANSAPKLTPQLPATPRGLHHVAFVTQDAQATVDFYADILQMPETLDLFLLLGNEPRVFHIIFDPPGYIGIH